MSKLAIIDGDALTYQSSKDTLQESVTILDEKISNIFEKTEATHYVVFISNTPYFRHKIDPLYKSGRTKYTSPLKWLKTLKKYLIEGWGAQSMNGVESDDLCSYWMSKDVKTIGNPFRLNEKGDSNPLLPGSFEKILCSADKDLLQSISNKNFNYSYKLEDKNNPNSLVKGWWIEISVEHASFFTWEQMICGDATDSIVGPYGKGKAWCDKNFAGKSLKEIQHLVFDEYIKEYGTEQGIHNFQKNFKLLHLLNTDEDFIREVGEIPTFPEIRQVPTKPVEEVNDDLKF